jgi:3-oxoadipate enol-lactonase/4-carboxymuconolactone decarboxylase
MKALPVSGGYLYYELEGSEHKPLIVFCNSLGTDARIWSSLIELLSNHYRFLRYDMRGHGLSTCLGGGDLGEHVDDLTLLLTELNVSQVFLCGLSVGGMVAQIVTDRRPDLIKGLILCATAPQIGSPDIWNDRIRSVQERGVSSIKDAVLSRWFSAEYKQLNPSEFSLWGNMLERTPAEGYVNICRAIRDADNQGVCSRLKVPTLCIAGERDGATPPELVKAMADLIPEAQYEVISGSGHLPCIEQPAALATLIDQFIVSQGKHACRFERGMSVRRSVLGSVHVDRAEAAKTAFDEPFQTFITESAWGSVWSRSGLSKRDRSLITIAMMAVLGHEEELAMHIRATANTGASMIEVREVLLQVAIYGGAPASNKAMRIAKREYARMAQDQNNNEDPTA